MDITKPTFIWIELLDYHIGTSRAYRLMKDKHLLKLQRDKLSEDVIDLFKVILLNYPMAKKFNSSQR